MKADYSSRIAVVLVRLLNIIIQLHHQAKIVEIGQTNASRSLAVKDVFRSFTIHTVT